MKGVSCAQRESRMRSGKDGMFAVRVGRRISYVSRDEGGVMCAARKSYAQW